MAKQEKETRLEYSAAGSASEAVTLFPISPSIPGTEEKKTNHLSAPYSKSRSMVVEQIVEVNIQIQTVAAFCQYF